MHRLVLLRHGEKLWNQLSKGSWFQVNYERWTCSVRLFEARRLPSIGPQGRRVPRAATPSSELGNFLITLTRYHRWCKRRTWNNLHRT